MSLNPLAVAFLFVASLFVLGSGTQHAVRAFLATAVFVPLAQQIVVAGLSFHFYRILVLVGLIRLLSKGETRGLELTKADRIFVGWVLAGVVLPMFREPTSAVLINSLGDAYNAAGTYFLIRFLTRDPAAIVGHLRFLAVIIALLAFLMVPEFAGSKNLFSVFGGVPEFPGERDGRLRCQGPFVTPILTGTFSASLFPMMVGLWFQDRPGRKLAAFGIAGSLFVTYASGSSGPLLSLLATFAGFGLWFMRDRMQVVRRSLVAGVLVMALFMNAPVWFLIAKISDLTGGTGWHRSYLIDQAVKHFGEWWLVGTGDTAHWAPAGQVLPVNPRMMDLTNHYVVQGVQGGLLRLVLFVSLIVLCYKTVGRLRRMDGDQPFDERLLWGLGVGLTAHCVAFISISYFDQINIFWFWLLAIFSLLSSLTSPARTPRQEASDQAENQPVPV